MNYQCKSGSNILCFAVTVADYISRAESQSRQTNQKELKKNKKELVSLENNATNQTSGPVCIRIGVRI
jgi:hypothetical protein